MMIEIKPLSDVTQEAIRILVRKMGSVNTIRFLNQFSTGYGDYTQERKELFSDLTFEEICAEIKQKAKK